MMITIQSMDSAVRRLPVKGHPVSPRLHEYAADHAMKPFWHYLAGHYAASTIL